MLRPAGYVVSGAALALVGSLFLATAHAAVPATLPAGKITPWAAMKIAVAKVPGKALNAMFEFDEGHRVYGVMVLTGKQIKEVEIDPMTGKVGDVENVNPAGEAREVESELKAAISGRAPAPEKGARAGKREKR